MRTNSKTILIGFLLIVVLMGLIRFGVYEKARYHQTTPEVDYANRRDSVVKSKLFSDTLVTPDTKKAFMDLTLEERQGVLDSLSQQSSAQILNAWLELAHDKEDIGKLEAVSRILSNSLHSDDPHEAEYAQLKAFAFDSSGDTEQKLAAIRLLGRIATPNSLAILLDLFHQNPDPTIQEAVLAQIKHTADERWEGRSHMELSPLLETEFSKTDSNSKEFQILASSISKIGAPTGINLLLENILTQSLTKSRSAGIDDDPTAYLIAVLKKVDNPANIPMLKKNLTVAQSPDDLLLVLSGNILVSIGGRDALSPVLDWAKSSDDDASQLIESWIYQVKDTESMELLKQTSLDFKRPENAAAFQAGLRRILSD